MTVPFPGTKRACDLGLGLLLLAVASPVMLLLALWVRVGLGSPVLFRQERLGLGGRPFQLLKFRTMRDARTAEGTLLSDVERLTPLGRWLRSTSLDELPELINVVRGEMSLVGPRPLLVDYLPLYSREQARRHEVRPGITGWAQVNGRNTVRWEERLAMDVWYVNHANFVLDLRILAKTIRKVLAREGITQEGQATMERFRGSAR